MSFNQQLNNCVFIKTIKRKTESDGESDRKKINLEREIENDDEICSFFNEEDLIVYSPGTDISESEYIDENNPQSSVEEPENFTQPEVGEPVELFLQNDNCFKTCKELPQCRECTKDEDCDKYSCRFYEFRKIEKSSSGTFKVSGFLDPHINPSLTDLDLWTTNDTDKSIDRESVNYILRYVTSQFCDMVLEEQEVIEHYNESCLGEPLIVWKRSVNQVREMCDVCSTSLFNLQWTCTSCGTSVCIDCYKERKANFVRWKVSTKMEKEERDKFFWYKCHDDAEHSLVLTQMIPGDSIRFLHENVHKVCDENKIPLQCVCRNTSNHFKMLCQKIKEEELNIKTNYFNTKVRRRHLKPPQASLVEQTDIYNRLKCEWVASGNVLKFPYPSESEDHYKAFQQQWQKGKPVIVANVHQNMRKFIWSPNYFLMRFGEKKHALVNCQNDTTIHRVRMKHFYEGYESIKKRLPEESENKMVLKLKDWPTSSDFADVMHEHFVDLMKAVPFSAYTTRSGKLNLVKYLHNFFSPPDLGPKMYSAYGQELMPAKAGSTNLHLDVSDAINILVHVSKPKDAELSPTQYGMEAIKRTMELCECDYNDIQKFLNGEKRPGAIWYIYPAKSAEGIRQVLHVVAKERGKPMNKTEDPLHNQDCFIDHTLRERLKSHGFYGYSIVQWEGDAIFIPGGAPHQVLNIFDCIKVALDFVSPENIGECFNLTTEFRQLSSRHANREDKLQIKNILYHVIKSLIPSKSEYDL